VVAPQANTGETPLEGTRGFSLKTKGEGAPMLPFEKEWRGAPKNQEKKQRVT